MVGLPHPALGLLAILPLLKERLTEPQDQYDLETAITSSKFLNNYINNCLVDRS